MDRHQKITIVAIVAISAPLVYSVLNIYAATHIQYMWGEQEKFSYFEMSKGGELQICNELPYWANFKKFEIAMYYDSANKGTFTIEQVSMPPSSQSTQEGIFRSSEFNESQYLFMQMDYEFDGGEIRMDPNKMNVIVNIETPIIGVIPYVTSMQYSGFDFDKIMKGEKLECQI